MEDTIVMEPGTLEEEAAQSVTVDQPELPAPEETEATEPVETDEPSSAYEDEDSAAKDPVVSRLLEKQAKDLEARLTQSFTDRQKNAAEQAAAQERQQLFAQQATQAAQWRQGEAARNFYGVLKHAEQRIGEGKSLDEVWGEVFPAVSQMASRIDQAAMTQAFVALQPVVNETLADVFPGYSAPAQLAEKFYGAIHRYDPVAVFKAVMEIAKDASRKDKGLETEIEQRVTQRIEGESRVKGVQSATANRRTPTLDVPPGGVRKTLTLQQIDAMPMSEWTAIPKEERRRLLDEAHRKAGR